MIRRRALCLIALPLWILATGLAFAGSAAAGQLECLPETCGWAISVGGSEVMSGSYDIDAGGNVSLGDRVISMTNSDFSVNINNIGGNVDPEIIFGLGATNTSGAPLTFAFSFSLPLGGLSGPLNTFAEIGQTLTAASGNDLTLFPTLGTGTLVDSQDIRFNPFASVDKGVDVGDVLFAAAGSTVLDLDQASSQIVLSGGGFDVMSVVVAFGLSDDGSVGLSGRVVQVVPEPGTALLLGLGLTALAVRRRA